MSTTPITRNGKTIPYTVVGGPKGRGGSEAVPVSLLLLDRGRHLFRNEVLREFDRLGFDSVLSVEEGGESFDLETLTQRYPRVRFLLLGESLSPGGKINLGVRESSAPFVFVLWNDMRLSTAGLSGRFFERLAEQDYLCLAPFLSSSRGEAVPSATAPALHRANLKVLPLAPAKDGAKTLYPFDYCGIYSKERFIQSGGFDEEIPSPYWQKLDFGFRAWLWGEELRLSQALRVSYEEDPPTEDSTVDADYARFWLRNLAPIYKGDSAVIPASRYWSYLRTGGRGILRSLREFREASDWVRTNRFRFRSGASSLVDLWEDEAP